MKGDALQQVVLKYKQGEDYVLDEIQQHIDPMIVSLVLKYKNKCEYEDLYQTAWVTIMRCLHNYRVESNILFSTYCYKAISNDLICAENKERKHRNKYDKNGNCITMLISKDKEYANEYGSLLWEDIIQDNEWEISKQVIFKELTPEVMKIAESLSPSPKRVVMDYLSGKRQCDIARELDVTYAYVSKVIKNFINTCNKQFE